MTFEEWFDYRLGCLAEIEICGFLQDKEDLEMVWDAASSSEREACIKIADSYVGLGSKAPGAIARAIRARREST